MTTNAVPESIDEKAAYAEIMQMLRYEGTMLWQRFLAFLVAHGLFAAALSHAAFDAQPHVLLVLVGAVLGLILCAAWWCTFSRGSGFFDLRIVQAKACEPKGWKIISDVGEQFSKGHWVQVGGEKIKMPYSGKLGMQWSAYAVIIAVAFFYILLIISKS